MRFVLISLHGYPKSPRDSKQTLPPSPQCPTKHSPNSSKIWWDLPPSHPRRCVGPGLGFRALSTLYQQLPHHSCPGAHPAPLHTTLLWQSPSLPRSARLLSSSHRPARDKMLRIRGGSTSTDTRGLKLGQVFREGGTRHLHFLFQIWWNQQAVLTPSSPSTKVVFPVTTKWFWDCLPGRYQSK